MVGTVYALCAIIIALEVIHFRERRDLYNRIHSKDYKEYTARHKEPPKAPKSRHDEILDAWRHKNKED